MLVSGSVDRTVRVWDLRGGDRNALHQLGNKDCDGGITCVALDHGHVAAGDLEGIVRGACRPSPPAAPKPKPQHVRFLPP